MRSVPTQRAVWPPHGIGNHGWVDFVLGAISGTQKTIKAIRSAQHDAAIVHVEATHVWTTQDESLGEDLQHFIREKAVDKAGQVSPVRPPDGQGDDVDAYLRCMGIFRLDSTSQGLERRLTETVEAYRRAARRAIPAIAHKQREPKVLQDGAFPSAHGEAA